jgi:hypothetical protein
MCSIADFLSANCYTEDDAQNERKILRALIESLKSDLPGSDARQAFHGAVMEQDDADSGWELFIDKARMLRDEMYQESQLADQVNEILCRLGLENQLTADWTAELVSFCYLSVFQFAGS